MATNPWQWTCGNILNRAAVEMGLDEVADPYSSTLAHFKQMKALLRTVGQELILARDWKELIKEMTITGDGAATEFALPVDFARMVNRSGWRRADQTPLGNPVGSAEWQYLKAYSGTVELSVLHRIVAGEIQFYTAPALATAIKADYVSRYWIATNGATDADAYEPADKDSVCVLEPLMVMRLLKVKFLQAKGFDASAALEEYRAAYEGAASNEPGSTIRLGDGGHFPFVSEWQLPDTGFGS